MSDSKPKVFLSYAHKDAWDFTHRLAFALAFYVDVFLDSKIQAGEFPKQLEQEIEECKYFIAVMSPYSQPEDSWCRRELRHAKKHNRTIVPVRIDSQHNDEELEQKYTYADFTNNYEQGFRGLTRLLLGTPHSSWEYLGIQRASSQILLDNLRDGRLPGLIAKELSEWAIVDQLWFSVQQMLSSKRLMTGTPRTPRGIVNLVPSLLSQITPMNDVSALYWVNGAKEIVKDHLDRFKGISDDKHDQAGKNAAETIEGIRKFLEKRSASKLDAWRVAEVQHYYNFNIAEKLAELVTLHARRSRYLY